MGILGIHWAATTPTWTAASAQTTHMATGPHRPRLASQVKNVTPPTMRNTTAARFWNAAVAPMKTGAWFSALGTSTTRNIPTPSADSSPTVPVDATNFTISSRRDRSTSTTPDGWWAIPQRTENVAPTPVPPVTPAR